MAKVALAERTSFDHPKCHGSGIDNSKFGSTNCWLQSYNTLSFLRSVSVSLPYSDPHFLSVISPAFLRILVLQGSILCPPRLARSILHNPASYVQSQRSFMIHLQRLECYKRSWSGGGRFKTPPTPGTLRMRRECLLGTHQALTCDAFY